MIRSNSYVLPVTDLLWTTSLSFSDSLGWTDSPAFLSLLLGLAWAVWVVQSIEASLVEKWSEMSRGRLWMRRRLRRGRGREFMHCGVGFDGQCHVHLFRLVSRDDE